MESRTGAPPEAWVRPLAPRTIRREGEDVVLEAQPRVVGPGRVERGYRERIEQLGSELARARDEREADLARAQGEHEAELSRARSELEAGLAAARRELETVELVERGSQRLLDRVERELDRGRSEIQELRRAQSRLVLALGALQAENQRLAGELARIGPGAPRPRSWLDRLLGRRRSDRS